MSRLACLFVVLFVAACSGRDDDNEARLFIERYDAVTRGTDEQRAARVTALRELPILNDEVRRVRDRCVEVHLAVLRAERYRDEANARLDVLLDASVVSAADQRAIEGLLARAEAATETVANGRNACLDGVSRLKAHHARRH